MSLGVNDLFVGDLLIGSPQDSQNQALEMHVVMVTAVEPNVQFTHAAYLREQAHGHTRTTKAYPGTFQLIRYSNPDIASQWAKEVIAMAKHRYPINNSHVQTIFDITRNSKGCLRFSCGGVSVAVQSSRKRLQRSYTQAIDHKGKHFPAGIDLAKKACESERLIKEDRSLLCNQFIILTIQRYCLLQGDAIPKAFQCNAELAFPDALKLLLQQDTEFTQHNVVIRTSALAPSSQLFCPATRLEAKSTEAVSVSSNTHSLPCCTLL